MSDFWRPVVGYEGIYEVSENGLVRRVSGRLRMLKPWLNHNGYPIVRLTNMSQGKRQTSFVHRLVAQAFIPNPRNLPVVNHINHDRLDRRAENLEWCTQGYNLEHARRAGRVRTDYRKGMRSPVAALSDDQVRALRAEYALGGKSWADVGREFGVSKRAAGRAIRRETYTDVQ